MEYLSSKLNKLTIRARLGLSFGVLILLAALVGVISLVSTGVQNKALEQAQTAQHQVALATQFEADLAVARQLEKEFFLTYPAIGVDAAIQAYAVPHQAKIDDMLLLIEELHTGETSDSGTAYLDVIEQAVVTYNTTFLDLVTTDIRQRGTNNEGLVGDLFETFRLLDAWAEAADDYKIKAAIAETLVVGLIYIQVPDEAEYVAFNQRIDDLEITVQESNLTAIQEESLIGLAEDAQAEFEMLVVADGTISEKKGEFDSAAEAIAPAVQTFIELEKQNENEALTAAENARVVVRGVQFVSLFLALGIGTVLALEMGRSLSTPISALTDVAREMAKGNLSVRTSVDREDELGRLSEAFNYMAEELYNQNNALQEHARIVSESEERLRTIFDSLSEAIIICDKDSHTIVDINSTMSEMFGFTHEEALKRNLESLSSDQKLSAKHLSSVHAGESLSLEVEARHKDGHQFWVEMQIRLAHVLGKERLLIAARDITRRKLAEQKLSQLNAELEQRVTERTRQLEEANEELVIARDEALAAERLKSKFLASVSHELRTPLNAVINFTQFVSSGMYGTVNDKQIDSLDKATNSARHLLGIINDILDISKIEAGGMDLFVEDDIDINTEIDNAAAITRALLEDKQVELLIDVEDQLPSILGDRSRIQQILLNIMSNAAKFTDAGTINVHAWKESQDIIISVQDSGPGIPEPEYEMIFQPFRQGKHPSHKMTSGTGLGLPISHQLAKAHGGRLWLDSTVGQGSTFYVALPIRSANLVSMLAEESK